MPAYNIANRHKKRHERGAVKEQKVVNSLVALSLSARFERKRSFDRFNFLRTDDILMILRLDRLLRFSPDQSRTMA